MVDLGGIRNLGTWWRGVFGTFMISSPILQHYDLLELRISNG